MNKQVDKAAHATVIQDETMSDKIFNDLMHEYNERMWSEFLLKQDKISSICSKVCTMF